MICDYGCGREGIFQNKSGKYSCAKHFSSCPEVKRKNSERIKQTYLDGRKPSKTSSIPWNKGLTKNSDERILLLANKAAKRKGTFTGKQHSEKTKTILSQKKKDLYLSGWEPICGRAKKYDYFSPIAGTIKVDGTWELIAAQYLDKCKLNWKRNKRRFKYINLEGKIASYQPDFYIESWKCYLEVKGYETALDKCKWSQFSEKLIIWRKEEIYKIRE